MLPICSFFASVAIACSLGTLPPEIANSAKPESPDQKKLPGYLERYQKTFEGTWLIVSRYKLTAKSSGIGSTDKSEGKVFLLTLPGLPEVFFWKTKNRSKSEDGFVKLHVGPCRLLWYYHEPNKHSLHCGSSDWRLLYIERFRVDDEMHVWFRGSVGNYEWIFEKGDLHHYLPPSGFFDGLAKKVFKAVQSPGPFGLLFNVRPNQLQKRLDLKLTKEDDHYLYIEAFPGNTDDKADFIKAQVVIDKDTFLPVRLWYAEPDHDTMTFNFTRVLTAP